MKESGARVPNLSFARRGEGRGLPSPHPISSCLLRSRVNAKEKKKKGKGKGGGKKKKGTQPRQPENYDPQHAPRILVRPREESFRLGPEKIIPPLFLWPESLYFFCLYNNPLGTRVRLSRGRKGELAYFSPHGKQ